MPKASSLIDAVELDERLLEVKGKWPSGIELAISPDVPSTMERHAGGCSFSLEEELLPGRRHYLLVKRDGKVVESHEFSAAPVAVKSCVLSEVFEDHRVRLALEFNRSGQAQ